MPARAPGMVDIDQSRENFSKVQVYLSAAGLGEKVFHVGVHAQLCLHLTPVHNTTTARTQHISSTALAGALTMMSFWTIMAHWLVPLGTHSTLLPVCREKLWVAH